MLIAALVLFIIAFVCRLLKLRLLFRIMYGSGKTSLRLAALLCGIRMLSYEFTAETDEKEFFKIKLYKKEKLKEEYTLETLTDKARLLIKEYKSSFDLVEQKLFDRLKVFLRKKIKIEELSLMAKFGLSDAFSTAMLLGTVYAAINVLLGRLYDITGIPKKVGVDIKPDFQKAFFEADITSMVSVRVSSLSVIGAAVVFLFLKNKAGKDNTENNKPAS